MSSKNLKTRDQIDSKYKWDIEAMIPDESLIDGDLQRLKEDAEAFAREYSGHLTDSADVLLSAFKKRDAIWQSLEKIYAYSHMKKDEDNANSKYQALNNKCMSVLAAVNASMAFFTPELLSGDENVILEYVKSTPALMVYDFAIRDTLRKKKHVLSESEEAILAQLGEVTGAPDDIFTMLNNADIKFGTIKDSDGDDVEVTHGNYSVFMESSNREVRKAAYEAMYAPYKNFINTISTAYNYNTKTDVISARIRKYDSARHAALSGGNIPGEVYDNLISEVNDNLPSLHRYMNLRKKLLGVDKLYMHDVYVPLIDIPKKEYPFEGGLDIMREALVPLGEEYLSKMNKGISQRWMDVYENQGKTSGAYSYGTYGNYPYILLNYTNTIKDVFTVIHEMGHSMHSVYSHENQPYIYGGHSIFTAEVASTVNESLLIEHLLAKETDKSMRSYLINLHLEAFRTTLFRQTMFAEFEDITHKAIEAGQVLTGEWMCQQYQELNDKYYGPAVEKDDTIRYEWARIPHFYRAFYVYQYATGYSAATAISEKILKEGKPAADDYISFLKTGDSNHPIELLKIAGVDMSSPEPVRNAMKKFNSLLDEFEKTI